MLIRKLGAVDQGVGWDHNFRKIAPDYNTKSYGVLEETKILALENSYPNRKVKA